MHVEEIKGTEAYLNFSNIYYGQIVGLFIIISNKCKIYLSVGYSLPLLLCVFDYSLVIYTGLFIWDEDKRISMMNVNLLWPWLHKGIHICLFLSIFMPQQQNKCVNSGLIFLFTASMDSNIITPSVTKICAK